MFNNTWQLLRTLAVSKFTASKTIIHFGMPKTGSSSIQLSLSQGLNDPRFHYIKLGSANASISLSTGFQQKPETMSFYQRKGTPKNKIYRLRKEVQRKFEDELQKANLRGAAGILSGESVANMGEPDFRSLTDFVGNQGGRITAVGYIRSPKAFMESAFQQKIKMGKASLDMQSLFFPYRRKLEKLDLVLNKKNVHFWHFDPDSFPGNCVVQDFCHRLGINFQIKNIVRSNEGLSLPAISLLFAYRKFHPGHEVGPTAIRENNLLVREMAGLPGPKLRLHSRLIAPVIEDRHEDISWMETRMGKSLLENLDCDDDEAVQSENDLLVFSHESLLWLAQQLGPIHVDQLHDNMTGQEVATWMHELRNKLAEKDERIQKVKRKLAHQSEQKY